MSDTVNIKQSPFTGIGTRTKGDKVIWALVLVLALASLLVVYSSTGLLAYKYNKGNTEVYLFKQIAFIAVGMAVIYFSHRVNYTLYSRVARILFLLSIPLLIYTLFFGVRLNEGSRWIRLPIINLTFQTSDLAKLALFMYVSRLLSKKQDLIKDFRKGFLPIIIPVGIICVLIAPANLSTALLIGATSMLLMFIGRVKTKHLLSTIGIAAIPVVILFITSMVYYDKEEGKCKELPAVLEVGRMPTWIKRVQNFVYDSKQVDKDENYQTNQAKIAIAQGGMLGLGPGKQFIQKFFAASLFRFHFCHHYRRVWIDGWSIYHFHLPALPVQKHTHFQKMPVCIRCVSGIGTKFYTGDSSINQYGCSSKSVSGNGCHLTTYKYGWKFIFVYVFIDWYHIECCKKRRAIGKAIIA
jgi:cell division protein FtsW